MNDKLKLSGYYATFVPTDEEVQLASSREGFLISMNDSKYLKYNFKKINDTWGQEYYELVLNTSENLSLVTDAYDLHYVAKYQDEQFGALVDPENPIITLFSDREPKISGFKRVDKYGWEKDIDISEIELIPVKEPIDLTKYLPK